MQIHIKLVTPKCYVDDKSVGMEYFDVLWKLLSANAEVQ